MHGLSRIMPPKQSWILIGGELIDREALSTFECFRRSFVYSIVDTALDLLGHEEVVSYDTGDGRAFNVLDYEQMRYYPLDETIADTKSAGYNLATHIAEFIGDRKIINIRFRKAATDYIVEVHFAI